MTGGCANLAIIPVCHKAVQFDLGAVCMLDSAPGTGKATQTVREATQTVEKQQFKNSACGMNWTY